MISHDIISLRTEAVGAGLTQNLCVAGYDWVDIMLLCANVANSFSIQILPEVGGFVLFNGAINVGIYGHFIFGGRGGHLALGNSVVGSVPFVPNTIKIVLNPAAGSQWLWCVIGGKKD